MRPDRQREENKNNNVLDVQKLRQQISDIMDSKTNLWIKIMTISRTFSGCHQKPERSFFIHGYQFPLCARCTGILLGYICSFLLLILGCSVSVRLCLVFLVPLILDGGIQLLFGILSNNIRRVATGILFGVGLIQLTVNIFTYLLSELKI